MKWSSTELAALFFCWFWGKMRRWLTAGGGGEKAGLRMEGSRQWEEFKLLKRANKSRREQYPHLSFKPSIKALWHKGRTGCLAQQTCCSSAQPPFAGLSKGCGFIKTRAQLPFRVLFLVLAAGPVPAGSVRKYSGIGSWVGALPQAAAPVCSDAPTSSFCKVIGGDGVPAGGTEMSVTGTSVPWDMC